MSPHKHIAGFIESSIMILTFIENVHHDSINSLFKHDRPTVLVVLIYLSM